MIAKLEHMWQQLIASAKSQTYLMKVSFKFSDMIATWKVIYV